MKYKANILFLLLCLLNIDSLGQSIPSYWMNIYNLENFFFIRNKEVDEVTVKRTGFYSSGETYSEKIIYKYASSYKLTGSVYKDGTLKAKFTTELDSLGRKVKSLVESNLPLAGWQTEGFTYEYQNGNRVAEHHYNDKNELLRIARYTYDSLQRPVTLTLTNSNNQLISFETATYNHTSKTYIHRVFNDTKELVLEEINYFITDTTENTRNQLGDYTQVVWPTTAPDKKTYHTLNYQYDAHGNWTKMERHLVSGSKKSRQSIVTRKIKYK